MFEIIEYETEGGESPFASWLEGLSDVNAMARVDARILRLTEGLFGDCKPVGEGVWELRVDWGPGYRVYYARAGKRLILLLCGGDKRKQSTDIRCSIRYWKNWQARTK